MQFEITEVVTEVVLSGIANDPFCFFRNVPCQLAEKHSGPFKKSGTEAYKRSFLPFYWSSGSSYLL